jgi:hypothetical protein
MCILIVIPAIEIDHSKKKIVGTTFLAHVKSLIMMHELFDLISQAGQRTYIFLKEALPPTFTTGKL